MNEQFAARGAFLEQAGWSGSVAILAGLPEDTACAQGMAIEE